jgi:serine/threonine-protein kinase HipA
MPAFKHVEVIEALAWGQQVGAAAFDSRRNAVAFEYAADWVARGIELAPLRMPLASARAPFIFPDLDPSAFKGLPGLLADALPDRFGNQVIDAWMAQKGYRPQDVSVLDRLAYVGRRAIGALEFRPARNIGAGAASALEMTALVAAARNAIEGRIDQSAKAADALRRVIAVGTSAGGARAKAVLGISLDRTRIVSGQRELPPGYEHWLLKFDGIGKDDSLGASQQYGRIEYAYHLMARQAGIAMMDCELLRENDRAHFMTRRFDRIGDERVHVQSLCALAHLSYNLSGTHAYESLFLAAQELGLGDETMTQLFRRMAFNIAAANHDDHTKNFAFLLRQGGRWELAPAYDVTFAFRSGSPWVSRHQMSVNGRFEGISAGDLRAVSARFSIAGVAQALREINAAVAAWPEFAASAGVTREAIDEVRRHHVRL